MIEFFNGPKLKPIRDFMLSGHYMILLFAVAAFFSTLEWNVLGVLVFACIIGVTLVLCDDLMTTFLPFMLLCLIAAKCYNSFSIFIQFKVLGVILVGCILLHFLLYRKKIVPRGALSFSMFGTSLAVTLGGVGFISAKEYFSPLSLFNIAALGFGMLFLYWLFLAHITVRREYSLLQKLTVIMVLTGCFASFVLVMYYAIHINEVLATHDLLFMQWRNNYSTFLMICIPFAFFYGHKKPYSIVLGFFFYFCILLTGSRGGLVFGAIEMLMCCVLFILYDKRRRLTYIAICLCLLFALMVFSKEFFSFFNSTLDRLLSAINGILVGEQQEVRYFQYQRGIKDFLSSPMFGTGIGYMGNQDVYHAADFALGWYHCELIQIPASLGTLGIVAYTYQFIRRLILLWKKPTMFNMTVFLSYISLELMSLVNPGIFSPIPYLLIMVFFFAIVENCNGGEHQHKIRLRKKKAKKSKTEPNVDTAIEAEMEAKTENTSDLSVPESTTSSTTETVDCKAAENVDVKA